MERGSVLKDKISTKDLDFFYKNYETEIQNNVLNGINIGINQGEFVAILGHNGSGKSTLAKHFNAILLPEGGSVTVFGMDTKDQDKLFEIRQSVGMVFQNPDNQIVATVVEEDVAFAPENLGVPQFEMRKRVDDALKSVEMYQFRKHAPHLLSGGQKQRVAIAGIIAMRPKCIVLDEPTAMLDPKGRKEVIETIKKLNKEENITIILITHYMDEAAKADRVVVMDNGKIVMDAAPKKVFSNVKQLKEIGLDVPQVTELAFLLRESGVKIDGDILKTDEFIAKISEILEEV